MAEQLALELGTLVAPPETVVSRCNEDAYALIAQWPRWPHPIVLVTGEAGSGKSHLAGRFAAEAGVETVPGAALTGELAVTLAAGTVVVDDADKADDTALFHLINAVRNAGSTMLLTATTRRRGGLADLDSRLRAVPEVALGAPDDALLRRVMFDAFARRQLAVDAAVVDFLIARMERTLHEAVEWPARLDHEGLARQRGPTRPLASRLIDAKTGST